MDMGLFRDLGLLAMFLFCFVVSTSVQDGVVKSNTATDMSTLTPGRCDNNKCEDATNKAKLLERITSPSTSVNTITFQPRPRPLCPNNFEPPQWKNINHPHIYCLPKSCLQKRCVLFNKTFEDCSFKQLLERDKYEVNNLTGEVTNLNDGSQSQLGEYFANDGQMTVCANNQTLSSKSATLPQMCLPFPLWANEFTTSDEGDLILLERKNVTISSPFYKLLAARRNRTAKAAFCINFSLDIMNCTTLIFKGDEHKILNDLSLWTRKDLQEVTYPLGKYTFTYDLAETNVCFDPAKYEPYFKLKSYHRVISCVSAFFLLVTLIVHFCLPRLNVRAKPLMCLLVAAISYRIVSTVQLVNYLASYKNHDSTVTYWLYLFCYAMQLASYCWLNVYCFVVWHTFTHLMENSATSKNLTKTDNRSFAFQCIYAWGIPIILCAILMSINANKDWQMALDMEVDIGGGIRLYSPINIAFYHVPMGILNIQLVVLFVLTTISIRKANNQTSILGKKVAKKHFVLFAKLFVIMGIGEIVPNILYKIGEANPTGPTAYIGATVFEMQGIFIFVVYVCKRRIYKEIKRKLGFAVEKRTSAELSTSTSDCQYSMTSSAETDSTSGNSHKMSTIEIDKKR